MTGSRTRSTEVTMPTEERDDEQLETEAEERAADEGMLAPEEDSETWGELESTKLDDDDEELGTDGKDISGPVAGDD
jgi:hypothetical protein